MIANPHRGEVEITLAGKAHVLRPTFAAIAEIEARTGSGVIELVRRLGAHQARIADLAVVVAAGLRGAGVPADYDRVAEQVFRSRMTEILAPVLDFLIHAVSGGRPPGEAQAAAPRVVTMGTATPPSTSAACVPLPCWS